MSCQLKYRYQACKHGHGQDCNDEIASKCKDFQAPPPRMTAEEFAAKQKELLQEIPVEFQSALSYKAWENGHSAGYEEVIGILMGLVSDLEEPIKKFEARIKSDLITQSKLYLAKN